jgi:hypothetical protein
VWSYDYLLARTAGGRATPESTSATTRRSARRQTVRAMCRRQQSSLPRGLTKCVSSGRESALLPEKVVRWVMTRGTTGRPKLIPVTEAHLSLILSVGARAIVNFAL